jgi:hypothetical protein
MDVVYQGLISGAVVVLGVVTAEWLQRARDRRRTIENATIELTTIVPRVVEVISETHVGDRETGFGSKWAEDCSRTIALVSEVRYAARWPLRRAEEIRRADDDLLARVVGAQWNYFLKNRLLTFDEGQEITGAALTAAVFGEQEPVNDRMDHYRDHGLEVSFDDCPECAKNRA